MKLPLISGQKLLKILSFKGFVSVRQRGSHIQLKNANGILITVPIHKKRPVSIGVLHKILRDSELSRAEFIELCNNI
ncbi:hypothetical protein COT30_03115 [Candidatus Micrarchaeota archaeon CG08_land_8_20_14_0_20_49_17]|nr:MAG: hypothetical protein AUJ13_02515 [Candidatus Micrarchaeota archaeon CG1_02_49_24]PIU09699.1 MAG: hypothetical protein COT30_03115 [Candidatus Micrarchaeota archaeon CG08_land_8_20_14_0_20_49_17]PIU82529.1 MAG: hypothetical protein COS70_00860 [Candidatus Micrarchaeota archaeon CG06_land_8_20_14_3_00_50_6]PIZ96681.1 MAG: hypothetical protein COX84_03685 [Candidatus Micrarchaeota archaeon CG_4_10_14_0_2_um_filter_49_7]HII53399.1 addiction module toxin, HicA family [Candidatus Micrarchaeot